MLREEVLHELRDAFEEIPLRVTTRQRQQVQIVATLTEHLGRAEFEELSSGRV